MAKKDENKENREPSFEETLSELEDIVTELESGDVNLQELMEKYSRGLALSQKCMKSLDRAEKTMDLMLKEENDEVQELKLSIEGE